MISKNVTKTLNEQIMKEIYSAYLYQSMAAFSAGKNLKGFASNYPITLNITYKDKFNEEYSVEKTIYANATGAPISITNIIFLIIIIAVIYWLYRKGHLDKHIKSVKKRFKKWFDCSEKLWKYLWIVLKRKIPQLL